MTDTQSTRAVNTPEILYRLRGVNGELLYVGVTRDFPARLKQHQADKPWFYEVRATEMVNIDGTRKQVEAIERAVIKTEAPIYNVTHNSEVADKRTQAQRDVDDLNAYFLKYGFFPIAFVYDDRRMVPLSQMADPWRRRGVELVGHFKYNRDDGRPHVRCTMDAEHECTLTAAQIALDGRLQCLEGPAL